MKIRLLNSTAYWAPPGEGDSGGAADASATLFPADAPKPAEAAPAETPPAPHPAGQEQPKPEGEQAKVDEQPKPDEQGEKDGEKDGEQPPEWQEYVDDPTKTAEENAALKAEHDKTKPEGDGEGDLDLAVPESYADIEMPEGIEVDKELLEAMTPVLKDLFITKTQAQALVTPFVQAMQARAQAEQQQFTKQVDDWAQAAAKEHGTNFDAVASRASGVVGRFGDDELKSVLNSSGLGNHPAMIRLFARVGELIGEDRPGPSNTEGKGAPAEAAHLLYANDAPKG